MNAELFHGDAEYPNIVDEADDGTPLPNCRGWACGTLYATEGAAELCCLESDVVADEMKA